MGVYVDTSRGAGVDEMEGRRRRKDNADSFGKVLKLEVDLMLELDRERGDTLVRRDLMGPDFSDEIESERSGPCEDMFDLWIGDPGICLWLWLVARFVDGRCRWCCERGRNLFPTIK